MRRNKTNNKNEEIGTLPTAATGTLSLGGELTVQHLGFGAMRITGEGTWGPHKNPLAVATKATGVTPSSSWQPAE